MEITLNGIPISEEQCIGDSLPYINAAFLSLKTAILESAAANNSSYLKVSDFIGYYPNTGGTVYGGVQVGGPGINSGAILRLGKTVNSSDGEVIETLPTIFCGSSVGTGNDLFINTNSANGKIFLRTGTTSVRTNAAVLDSNGNVNMAVGNVCIGSTAIGSQKLEVVGGNVKITSFAGPTLILNNNIPNSLQWTSRIRFASNDVNKYELGVDPTSTGINQFYIYDSVALTNRFIIRNDGKVYIPGNVGIGIEPVANKSLKIAGDLEVGGSLSILGTFTTAGINSSGPVTGTALSGTSGTFTGKVTTNNLESTGPISGTTGTFSGKVSVTSPNGIESSGPILGTTGTFSGKVNVTSPNGIECLGPITGLGYAGGPISGTTGTFVNTLTCSTEILAPQIIVDEMTATIATIERLDVTNEVNTIELVTVTLSCAGIAVIDDSLTVKSGNISLGGNTYVGGSARITNTLSVTGLTQVTGDLTVTGNISSNGDIIGFQTSDERLKRNITVIPNALEKINDIRGCEFEWDETLAQPHLKGKSAGVIAQDVEKVFPQAVTTREDGYKAVRYEYIIPLLIEAVKDLQDEIEDLKAKLNT